MKILAWLKEVNEWLDGAWKPVKPSPSYRDEGFGHGSIDFSKKQCEENAGEAGEWREYGKHTGFATEGDMYESITGRRSTALDDASKRTDKR